MSCTFYSNMKSFVILTLAIFFFFFGALDARPYPSLYDPPQVVTRTITVDKQGRGQFTSVQQAINSIPSNNNVWIRIHINPGVYEEQVIIPQDKPYIILEGDSNHLNFPVIQNDKNPGNVITGAVFRLFADNFVARNIIFKNTYNRPNDVKDIKQAVAAAIYGDKASFYHCAFHSVQDTLSDFKGRHYFYACYIEGGVDFIWGGVGSGYITAQGRNGEKNPSDFVFKLCYISGAGPIMLGRAYRPYSRVLFFRTYMENIIQPEGWAAPWNKGRNDITAFSEVKCNGPGADTSLLVPWQKNQISTREASYFINPASFIDQEGWLGKQPK